MYSVGDYGWMLADMRRTQACEGSTVGKLGLC